MGSSPIRPSKQKAHSLWAFCLVDLYTARTVGSVEQSAQSNIEHVRMIAKHFAEVALATYPSGPPKKEPHFCEALSFGVLMLDWR